MKSPNVEENSDNDFFDPMNQNDSEILELLKDGNLIELHDVLPTAFILAAQSGSANDMKRFKTRYTDIHIGKGLCLHENMPEKHCLKNQWILKPDKLN